MAVESGLQTEEYKKLECIGVHETYSRRAHYTIQEMKICYRKLKETGR
jgi:hypothetical protein